VIRADSRHLPLAGDTVDLVVTSPPYFALRSYQDGGEHYDGQIGDEPTPAEFLDALLEVTRECVRVLKPSGSLWVNLGDKYSNGGRTSYDITDLNGNRGGVRTPDGFRPKTLLGIPWRYAIRCIDELGLILRAEVVWSKPNGLPESVTDRVRRSHEQWFHFTLEPRYYSAVDEIREEHARSWGAGSNGGTRPAMVGASSQYDGLAGSAPNPLGKLPGSVWEIPTEPLIVPEHLGVDHFAAFPTEWPRRIIQGWSPAGVCVECGEGRRTARSGAWHFQTPGHDVGRRALQKAIDAGVTADIVGTEYGTKTKAGDNTSDGPRNVHPTVFRLAGDFGITRLAASAAMAATKRALGGHVCACPEPTAPTRPGVVLDPFGGTGTTALVAKALGRHGISVDMSADYCRLAEWRTNDPAQLAKAARRPFKPSAPPIAGQSDLLAMLTEDEEEAS
jgi:DNA modification methylase